FTLCCGAGLPVPLRASLRVELVALLANDSVALALPLAWGVNTTVTGRLCPALMVKGNDMPLSLNSGVVMLADETVTLEPLALRLAVSDLFWPTITVPKSSETGLMPIWPGTVPEPDNTIVKVTLAASEVIEIPPLSVPPLAGEYDTPKVKL